MLTKQHQKDMDARRKQLVQDMEHFLFQNDIDYMEVDWVYDQTIGLHVAQLIAREGSGERGYFLGTFIVAKEHTKNK